MPGFETSLPALVLLVRAGSRRCALRAVDVVEAMRPLPMEPPGNAPEFVLGVAVIRGRPVPVVHLGQLLGDRADGGTARFVCLRVGERQVALAVDEVIGLRPLDPLSLGELPPLLSGGSRAVEALGTLDAQLLLLLESARILPEAPGEP